MEMWKEFVTVSGAWIQAVGTVIAAFATIEELTKEQYAKEKYEIAGNALQAIGNALQVIVQPGKSLEKMGGELQALGNTSVIIGVTLDIYEKDTINEVLEIVGNSLQSIGAGLAAIEELQDVVVSSQIEAIGNTLQSIGNGLQALQGIYNIEDEQEEAQKEEGAKGTKEEELKEEKQELMKENSNINGMNNKDKKEGKDETIGDAGSWIQAAGSVITAIGTTIGVEKKERK